MRDENKPKAPDQSLAAYHLLGRTGLRVSPMCLGTMTFGWGADKQASSGLFQRFLELGGNFFDTADAYGNGTSEEWLGEFIAQSATRDKVVLATKFTFNQSRDNPNSGGNGRKNIRRAIEASLKRLRTDYVDLYWLHAWDTLTPIEEVMTTLNDLVREGKVLHLGLSDVPAWYAARAQTLAEERNYEPVAALQLEYSLISRSLEREHVPMMHELGIALCPWSPLASGFLTGKYRKTAEGIEGRGRVQEIKTSGNPVFEKFARDARNWDILEAVMAVAKELDRSPTDVALNWVAKNPNVSSTIIGATTLEQLNANISTLTFDLPPHLRQRLDDISRPALNELDPFFGPVVQSYISGGANVTKQRCR